MNFEIVKVEEDKVFSIAECNFDSWIKLKEYYSRLKNIFGKDKRIIIMHKNNWQELRYVMDETKWAAVVGMVEYKEETPDKKYITGVFNNFIFDL